MKIKYGVFVSALIAGILLSAQTADAGPVLNYQGRITAEGSDFSGTGLFKFVFLNQHDERVWSNDGTGGISQPAGHVSIPVQNGLFNVNLGDPAIVDMASIPPLAFHEQNLRLRVWFSDGSGFEQLSPDVQINAPDFSQINTGNLLIVDQNGRGDFNNLQDAVNYAAANTYHSAILVMPGSYYGAVNLPSDSHHLVLRGAAHGGAVLIHNNGPVFSFGENSHVQLENLSISGSPALSNESLPEESWSAVTLRKCELSPPSHETSDPVVSLQGRGELFLFDSAVRNYANGPAVTLGGNARLEAAHSRLEAGTDSALKIMGNAQVEMQSCTLQSETEATFLAEYTSHQGQSRFILCSFHGGITITDSHLRTELIGCGLESGWGQKRIQVSGGNANLQIKDSRISSFGETAVQIENASGQIRINGCSVFAGDASAIHVLATPEWTGNWLDLNILNSHVIVHSDTVTDKDAIVLENDSGGEIELAAENSTIGGYIRNGITAGADCWVVLNGSQVEGELHGIYAPYEAEVEVLKSNIWSEDGDALHMGGPGFVFMQGSDVMAEGGGRGVYLNFSEEGAALIFNSLIGGWGGAGIEAIGGMVLCNHTTILTGSDAMVRLAGASNESRFNHCVFKSIAEFGDEDNGDPEPHLSPCVLLVGAQGQTPVPLFFACSFEPSEDASHSVVLDSAATGNIALINSVLGKSLGSGISNVAPAADNRGNVVLP